jgi:hypothetical protein
MLPQLLAMQQRPSYMQGLHALGLPPAAIARDRRCAALVWPAHLAGGRRWSHSFASAAPHRCARMPPPPLHGTKCVRCRVSRLQCAVRTKLGRNGFELRASGADQGADVWLPQGVVKDQHGSRSRQPRILRDFFSHFPVNHVQTPHINTITFITSLW